MITHDILYTLLAKAGVVVDKTSKSEHATIVNRLTQRFADEALALFASKDNISLSFYYQASKVNEKYDVCRVLKIYRATCKTRPWRLEVRQYYREFIWEYGVHIPKNYEINRSCRWMTGPVPPVEKMKRVYQLVGEFMRPLSSLDDLTCRIMTDDGDLENYVGIDELECEGRKKAAWLLSKVTKFDT